MKHFLATRLIESLALVNVFPSRMTDPKRVSTLIRKLHPLVPSRDLIRLGPNADGGYLVPDDLAGITACFSPGVSSVSGFERDCADRGLLVFLADKSVDGPAQEHERFRFSKKFIGATSDDDFMTLDEWIDASTPDRHSDLLLQMDIEGYEYEAFLSASHELMTRFRIIVAEFHNLHYLWSDTFFTLVEHTFDKVLQTHACVHIHPNNCCGSIRVGRIEIPRTMEFTFQRRDRLSTVERRKSFPHPLDFDNTRNPSLRLPRCWYAGE